MTESETFAVELNETRAVLDDLLAALVDADKTRHYNPDPDISHAHVVFDERTQTKLTSIYARFSRLQERRHPHIDFQASIRKYGTVGELAAAYGEQAAG